jgi:hypothetical protein
MPFAFSTSVQPLSFTITAKSSARDHISRLFGMSMRTFVEAVVIALGRGLVYLESHLLLVGQNVVDLVHGAAERPSTRS